MRVLKGCLGLPWAFGDVAHSGLRTGLLLVLENSGLSDASRMRFGAGEARLDPTIESVCAVTLRPRSIWIFRRAFLAGEPCGPASEVCKFV